MRYALSATAALSLVLIGCTSEPTTPGHVHGGVHVLLTDSPFPFDRVAHADIYVVQIAAGTDSGSTGAACGGATVLAEPRRSFDLLALQRGATALLGDGSLPDGSYATVCVTINTDSSFLILRDGTVLRHDTDPGINWSGSGERIIKADIIRPIEVVDTTGTFVIHFDVGNSFIQAADVEPVGPEGWFYYVPAITAIDPTTVGSVAGTVTDSGSSPVANASVRAMVGDPNMDPGTWFVAATGGTDSLGRFRLGFLKPSSELGGAGWVYIIKAYPPTAASLGSRSFTNVAVSAGGATDLGTFALPALP